MDQETSDERRTGENLSPVDQGASEKPKKSEENVCATAENKGLRLKNGDFGSTPELPGQIDPGTSGNSSNSVDGNVFENVTVISSGENGLLSEGNGDLGVKINELGLSEALAGARKGVVSQERHDARGIGGTTGQTNQEISGNSNNPVDGSLVETIIVINAQDAACVGGGRSSSEVKCNELGPSKVSGDKPKTKVAEREKESCVIDIKGDASGGRKFTESPDGERVCRICHLSAEQTLESVDVTLAPGTATMDLIQLGCGCKDELGIAHSHCAEAWFKLKGNRFCEICGQSAKNITGVGDNRFIDEWNEQGFSGGGSSSERGGGCWRGQPFCNFLMACLVIAFVLPWFFRVNMF